jgi:uncharacterized protein YdaU (DUF1376 family)
MKEKAPHMPWYGREFYADENVLVMSLEQEAAYLRLVWNCWQEGSIPKDLAKLAAICKNMPLRKFERTIWPALIDCFSETADGRLVHQKVEDLRAAKDRFKTECSAAGKRGADARWRNQNSDGVSIGYPIDTLQKGDGVSMPVDCRLPIVDCRIPNTHTEPRAPKAADLSGQTSDRFEEFWESYPRKQRKDFACAQWVSVVTTENEAAVFDCLNRYLKSDEVARAVVMNPDKWLCEQHRNGWTGDWPAARVSGAPAETREQRRQAEIDRHWAAVGNQGSVTDGTR